MKYLHSFFICLLGLLAFSACSDASVEEEKELKEVLYANSFENPQDLIGFEYAEVEEIAPIQGGDQSISVSLGCIMPHTVANIGPYPEDVDVIVSVEAFLDPAYLNSFAEMLLKIDDKQWSYPITSPVWSSHRSEVISLPQGSRMYMSLNAGGFVASKAYFDLLTVERAEDN